MARDRRGTRQVNGNDPDHLKIQARRLEADGDYSEAKDLYLRALRAVEEQQALADPSMLVRVADLEYREGHEDRALEYYERAVEKYSEEGLITNAIAVCNKVLRVYPEEHDFFRRLAMLHVEVGLVAEARQNLLQYVSSVWDLDRPDRALEGMREFLDRTPDQDTCLHMASFLSELGREEEALEVLRSVWRRRMERDEEVEALEWKAHKLEPTLDLDEWRRPASSGSGGESGGEPGEAPDDPGPGSEDLATFQVIEGFDRMGSFESRGALEPDDVGEIEEIEDADTLGTEEAETEEAETEDIEEFEREPAGTAATEEETMDTGTGTDERDMELEREERDSGTAAEAGPEEYAAAAGEPGPAVSERESGGELGERAELLRGLELLDEMLELQPENLELRERKLRYARRLGEPEALADALLGLADSLADRGERRSARFLYHRLLELEPRHSGAESGLTRLEALELEQKRQAGKRAGAAHSTPKQASPEEKEARRRLGLRMWSEFEGAIRELPWLHAATQVYQATGPEVAPPLEAFEMLGHYLLSRGHDAQAVEVLSWAEDLAEDEDERLADIFYHLGMAHRRLGDEEEAGRYFDRLARRDPEFARLRDEVPDPEPADESPAGDGEEFADGSSRWGGPLRAPTSQTQIGG